MRGNKSYIELKKTALMQYFSRMNDMQKKAVFTVNGPLLVLAGAGSGKTTVIVNRIANMINFGNAYFDETRSGNADDIEFLEAYINGETDETAVPELYGYEILVSSTGKDGKYKSVFA